MQIMIDADGCPVTVQTIALATKYALPCILVCDTSHSFSGEGIQVLTVSKGADSADYAIVNTMASGDIVVTQDYGLAAMALARGGHPITQNGLVLTDDNIGALLESRHIAKKIRSAGGRLKGPAKRTAGQNQEFIMALEALIRNLID